MTLIRTSLSWSADILDLAGEDSQYVGRLHNEYGILRKTRLTHGFQFRQGPNSSVDHTG